MSSGAPPLAVGSSQLNHNILWEVNFKWNLWDSLRACATHEVELDPPIGAGRQVTPPSSHSLDRVQDLTQQMSHTGGGRYPALDAVEIVNLDSGFRRNDGCRILKIGPEGKVCACSACTTPAAPTSSATTRLSALTTAQMTFRRLWQPWGQARSRSFPEAYSPRGRTAHCRD